MPPRGHRRCDYAVHVRLENRHFIVEYGADGDVQRIKERKTCFPGEHWECIADKSWWVPTSHPLGTGNTMPKRVIAATLAKTTAEDLAHNATP